MRQRTYEEEKNYASNRRMQIERMMRKFDWHHHSFNNARLLGYHVYREWFSRDENDSSRVIYHDIKLDPFIAFTDESIPFSELHSRMLKRFRMLKEMLDPFYN